MDKLEELENRIRFLEEQLMRLQWHQYYIPAPMPAVPQPFINPIFYTARTCGT